ncbi:MAG: thiol peroxidase [Candidatus Dadabacteria bacterium]|nr:thiol peroxidase [Candidatus Dadabacteria bacterium]
MERDDAVKMKGNPITLIGPELKKGDQAPDFRCVETLGSEISLENFGDDVKVFNVVVSVDTPVCDVQIRRFNEEAAAFSDSVQIITVSMDLPFAQSRYCAAAEVERVKTASDYQYASFGEAYGVLIKENRLLARAIFVVGRDNVIEHVEYVGDIVNEPDYNAALDAIKSIG